MSRRSRAQSSALFTISRCFFPLDRNNSGLTKLADFQRGAFHGTLTMEFRDHAVNIAPGEFLIVPHGVEHRPVAEDEVHVLLLEPGSTVNTGTAGGKRMSAHAQAVTRVVDGDTVVVAGVGVVRLIGVDTPETRHRLKPVERFGAEASAFLGEGGVATWT